MELKELRDIEMDMYEEEWPDFVKRITREGLTIVYPEPNQLLIDIDTEEQYQTFKKMEVALHKYFGVIDKKESVSRNGLPGRHIILDLTYNLDAMERIILQAVMGSDPMREFLSYMRVKNNTEHPTVLLEKKPE